MGKILSVAAKKAQRFNVENRAHKIISMEKPIPAPKHPSSQKEIDMLLKDHGDAFNDLQLKDKMLDDNLRHVYVTSSAVEMNKFGKPSDRSRFPVNRSTSIDSELGYKEPEVIPVGKITLRQAMEVLNSKLESSERVSAEGIANSLNIAKSDAENLVKYFSSLKIFMPETVPKIGAAQKAKRALIRQMSNTKVESLEATPASLRLDNPPRDKPA